MEPAGGGGGLDLGVPQLLLLGDFNVLFDKAALN